MIKKPCEVCAEKKTCWVLQMIARMLELGAVVEKAHCQKYQFTKE